MNKEIWHKIKELENKVSFIYKKLLELEVSPTLTDDELELLVSLDLGDECLSMVEIEKEIEKEEIKISNMFHWKQLGYLDFIENLNMLEGLGLEYPSLNEMLYMMENKDKYNIPPFVERVWVGLDSMMDTKTLEVTYNGEGHKSWFIPIEK